MNKEKQKNNDILSLAFIYGGTDKELMLLDRIHKVDDKIDSVDSRLNARIDEKTDVLQQKIDQALVIAEENKKTIIEGIDGNDGENYILTEQDKTEIAQQINVPVVEKVIEKIQVRTEVVREKPVVTEIVKEIRVENSLTIEEIISMINALPKDGLKIDASHLVNLPKSTREIIHEVGGHAGAMETPIISGNSNATITKDAFGRWVVTVTASSIPSLSSGAVNGTNQTYVWSSAPTAIVVDQGRIMQKVSSDGTVNWTGTTTTVLTVAPNFDVYAIA